MYFIASESSMDFVIRAAAYNAPLAVDAESNFPNIPLLLRMLQDRGISNDQKCTKFENPFVSSLFPVAGRVRI